MGFRFKKRFKIAPGIFLNLNKSTFGFGKGKGGSITIGNPGLGVNINRDGIQGTAAIKGSGISYRTGRLSTTNLISQSQSASSRKKTVRELQLPTLRQQLNLAPPQGWFSKSFKRKPKGYRLCRCGHFEFELAEHKLIGEEYLYSNKDGGPDLRRRYNPVIQTLNITVECNVCHEHQDAEAVMIKP